MEEESCLGSEDSINEITLEENAEHSDWAFW
jgi:hypothetical protein